MAVKNPLSWLIYERDGKILETDRLFYDRRTTYWLISVHLARGIRDYVAVKSLDYLENSNRQTRSWQLMFQK
jgi:hypothetical protein